MNNPSILPCRKMWFGFDPAREKILGKSGIEMIDPIQKCYSRLIRQFELNRTPCLPLRYGRTLSYSAAGINVVNSKPHEITAAQLAVDCEIEESKIALLVRQLEPDANGPDILRLERLLPPNKMALIPRRSLFRRGGRSEKT